MKQSLCLLLQSVLQSLDAEEAFLNERFTAIKTLSRRCLPIYNRCRAKFETTLILGAMGIRFNCSHCNKPLNIKPTQAGQVGQCPACQASITVPALPANTKIQGTNIQATKTPATKPQSAAPQNRDENSVSIFDVDHQIAEAGLSASIKLDSEPVEEFSVPFSPPSLGTKKSKFADKDTGDSFLLEKPLPPSTMGKVDPIAEAPRKVWYFRSKTLGEKGPLKGKVMQQYLDSGDVTIGCIVWREDWEDWQPAEKVFPPLVALADNTSNQAFRDANYLIPDELNPHSSFQRKRRQMRILGIIAIAAGLLTIGVLVYFLIELMAG
jgi:uncharacterized Zn finger protein (UPF0148 family)